MNPWHARQAFYGTPNLAPNPVPVWPFVVGGVALAGAGGLAYCIPRTYREKAVPVLDTSSGEPKVRSGRAVADYRGCGGGPNPYRVALLVDDDYPVDETYFATKQAALEAFDAAVKTSDASEKQENPMGALIVGGLAVAAAGGTYAYCRSTVMLDEVRSFDAGDAGMHPTKVQRLLRYTGCFSGAEPYEVELVFSTEGFARDEDKNVRSRVFKKFSDKESAKDYYASLDPIFEVEDVKSDPEALKLIAGLGLISVVLYNDFSGTDAPSVTPSSKEPPPMGPMDGEKQENPVWPFLVGAAVIGGGAAAYAYCREQVVFEQTMKVGDVETIRRVSWKGCMDDKPYRAFQQIAGKKDSKDFGTEQEAKDWLGLTKDSKDDADDEAKADETPKKDDDKAELPAPDLKPGQAYPGIELPLGTYDELAGRSMTFTFNGNEQKSAPFPPNVQIFKSSEEMGQKAPITADGQPVGHLEFKGGLVFYVADAVGKHSFRVERPGQGPKLSVITVVPRPVEGNPYTDVQNQCSPCIARGLCCDPRDGGCFDCDVPAIRHPGRRPSRRSLRRNPSPAPGLTRAKVRAMVQEFGEPVEKFSGAAREWAQQAQNEVDASYRAGWNDGARGMYRPRGIRDFYDAGWNDGAPWWAQSGF